MEAGLRGGEGKRKGGGLCWEGALSSSSMEQSPRLSKCHHNDDI